MTFNLQKWFNIMNMEKLKIKIHDFLRWTEKWTKTDMVYLAKGGFWLTLGQIISSISSFALALCFANLLPKETYGTYQYILSITGVLAATALSGINIALIQAISRGFEGDILTAIKTKIRWALFGSIASIGLAGYYFLQKDITLTICFLIVSLFLPIMDSFGVYDSYLQGKKYFKISTKYRITSQLICVISLIITLLITKNLFIIVFVYFFSWTSLRFILLKITLKNFELNKIKDPETISFGKHLSLMDILQSIAGQADKILIYHYVGATELAIYAFASAPLSQIKSFLLNIKILALPKLSITPSDQIKKYLPKKIFKAELLLFFVVLSYIIVAPYIFLIIFPQYQQSIIFSQILAITLLFLPRTLLSSSLSAKKQIKSLYKIKIYGPVIKVIIYFIFIQIYGLLGLVIGRVLTEIYLIFLYNYYFKKITD